MDNNDIKTIQYVSNLIEPNDVLVDVGANNGEYTDFFNGRTNGKGKIYCIELLPETYNSLVNKFKNDSNIIVLNHAICDKNEMIPYYGGVNSQTNNIIGHDMNFNPNGKLGEISGLRLDTLLETEEQIKLIKIDVEGAELSVLKGLEGIINKVDNLLIECHLDKDWSEINDLLLKTYKLSCTNVLTNTEITTDSPRAYQCFCKKSQ